MAQHAVEGIMVKSVLNSMEWIEISEGWHEFRHSRRHRSGPSPRPVGEDRLNGEESAASLTRCFSKTVVPTHKKEK